ncbi:MAG: glutamate-1-semialdehyde 2,1-aminomutase [Crenarchaeota archaeon]|nr:glutamate-1-semialdehyde 2,1-aminomutase [Thermoproteota archaeon]
MCERYCEIFRISSRLYEEARKLFPGGVNSPVRLMRHLPYPFYVKEAYGPYLITVDDVKLIDYCMGFGPLILGHRPRPVLEKVREYLERGWMYGTPTEIEIEYAKTIMRYFPSIEMMRIVNTGTEATMNAIRLARAYTKRKYIVKFDGCYHGAHDHVLVKAGSGAATWGVPTSAGVLEEVARYTIVLPFNDIESVEKTFRELGNEIACIIVEPIMGNYGLVPGDPEFIKTLREVCDRYGSLLIFDEVITGFRVDIGGAQKIYNVRPDITTLGKIVGGGFPIGIFGGRREIMELITPLGPVYNAGTFNAHPISLVAGLATIRELEKGYPYEIANRASEEITKAIQDVATDCKIPIKVIRVASMFQIYFTERDIKNADDVRSSNVKLYEKLHKKCLLEGLYLTPSQYEVNFTSAAHDDEVVQKTIEILCKCLREISRS